MAQQRYHQKLEPQAAPAFFARGPSPFARLMFFSALSITLMATDAKLHYLNAIRLQLVALTHPLQMLANAPSDIYRGLDAYFSTHRFLLEESKTLNQRVLNQEASLQRLGTLTLENNHLRQLLNAANVLPQSAMIAEIMHVGRDPFTKKIVINRGETHAVKAGEAVVDATGVIGQVTRVYPLSSEVTLITDKSLSIPVQVERNGLRAIAFGHGRDNTLNLPYLPTNVDIKRGDKLVTSGIDGVYPAGLAVAIVSDIEITQDSPFARIVCEPIGGVEYHRQVLLVSMPTATSAGPVTPAPVHAKATPELNAVGQTHEQLTAPANNVPSHPLPSNASSTNATRNSATPAVKAQPSEVHRAPQ
jgi:rod shape-determining protein MreC